MSNNKRTITSEEQSSKKLFIYAQVDIDRAYGEIVLKSKKIKSFVEEKNLANEFIEKIRVYKNFRIVFDSEIQKFIQKKQLHPDLRIIKKNVFVHLEEFILSRYSLVLEEQRLSKEYNMKVHEIQNIFIQRMKDLSQNLTH